MNCIIGTVVVITSLLWWQRKYVKHESIYARYTYSIVQHLHIFITYDGICIVLWQVGGDGDQEVVVAMVTEFKAPNLNSSTKRRPSDFEVTPSGLNFCTLFLH